MLGNSQHFFLKMKQYKQLIDEYLALGGSQSFIDRLPAVYSLSSEAKIRREIRLLKEKRIVSQDSEPAVGKNTTNDKKDKPYDYISDYPVQLHGMYLQRKAMFLKCCSLKQQLNGIDANDVDTALRLQLQIWKLFQFVDLANKHLEYYREHKRILPQKTEVDFSQLTAPQLVQKRLTLRSNIANRKKTIAKLQEQLLTANDSNKLRLRDKLSGKIEQLEEMNLQIKKLDQLLDS